MANNVWRFPERIAIVGTTGSGKTTLAGQLAEYLQMPHIELDALYWEPNWKTASEPLFRERVAAALGGNRWVSDGNYSLVRDLVWSRADTVVFLDYPFGLTLGRLLQRTWRRSIDRQELWQGNRETLRKSFLSRHSILLWMLQTYRRNRQKYPRLFAKSEYAHLSIVHLRSLQMTEEWVKNIQIQTQTPPDR
ncbi:MAG: adenylate kinase [Cyanobacteriota bacterium]|nr:adenylate kinase [Cyanobacteriota bacterium]